MDAPTHEEPWEFWKARAEKAEAELAQAKTDHAAEVESWRAALQEIDSWSRSYPLKVFPEPNFDKARELLAAGDMTLDAISASNMRHVIEGVGQIARAALTPQEPQGEK